MDIFHSSDLTSETDGRIRCHRFRWPWSWSSVYGFRKGIRYLFHSKYLNFDLFWRLFGRLWARGCVSALQGEYGAGTFLPFPIRLSMAIDVFFVSHLIPTWGRERKSACHDIACMDSLLLFRQYARILWRIDDRSSPLMNPLSWTSSYTCPQWSTFVQSVSQLTITAVLGLWENKIMTETVSDSLHPLRMAENYLLLLCRWTKIHSSCSALKVMMN